MIRSVWREAARRLVRPVSATALVSAGVLWTIVAPRAAAQAAPSVRFPSDGGTTFSLGQPGKWLAGGGVATGIERRDGNPQAVSEVRAGLYYEMVSRVLGIGGIQTEAYSGMLSTRLNGGVRVRAVSPFLRLGLGVDFSGVDHQWRSLISLSHPLRRGGLFHDGSMLRIDYRAGPERMLTVGVEAPFLRKIPLGTTRPRSDRIVLRGRPAPMVSLPEGRPALAEALVVARAAAHEMLELTVPWVDHTGGGGDASDSMVVARLRAIGARARRTTLQQETRRWHAAIEQAFTLALAPGDSVPDPRGSPMGRRMADAARTVLLEEVLIPYDRLLGQAKDPDTLREFALHARSAFLHWLHVEAGAAPLVGTPALAVFGELLDIVEDVRRVAHLQWNGSRFVWLPVQLALLPEQHDTQAELDLLVARFAGEPITDGNDISYVINEQFQFQLSRTIHAARQYHVLWTHDFRGVDARGDPDEMSFRHVLRSYLAAMTARVREDDRTGVFPTYILILDEWFYRANKSRLWLDLFEDPLGHRVNLPRRFTAWEDSLAQAQDALRDAVHGSSLLQAQRRHFGDAWLRTLIKVHVNITNVSDPSFTSWRVASAFPVPDTWMRDHRKLVFYDVTERDLYRGEAIVTGAGVGEHYANLSWEDRSLLVRGPATLSLKTAARELLLSQGVRDDRIPAVLRPEARAVDHDAQVEHAQRTQGRRLRALLLQNRTGYADKRLNVTRALLYTLMPPGSVIKIPDSLWNGTFWGNALIGAALRGVRILVIAPTLANAPARAFGSMIRSRELLWRFIMAERTFGDVIAREGGLLKVGLYASEIPVSNVPGKILAVRATLSQHPWLRELFGFPASVYTGLEEIAATFGALPTPRREGPEFEARSRPLLHLKANFLASREAWSVMARTDWVDLTREFVPLRMSQLQAPGAAVATFGDTAAARIDVGGTVVQRWYDDLAPADRDRVVFYTLIGSANQNDRSMVSDGEASLLMAGWPSVTATIDLISLIGQSRWIDDPAELDRLLPRRNSTFTRIAHWFKFAF